MSCDENVIQLYPFFKGAKGDPGASTAEAQAAAAAAKESAEAADALVKQLATPQGASIVGYTPHKKLTASTVQSAIDMLYDSVDRYRWQELAFMDFFPDDTGATECTDKLLAAVATAKTLIASGVQGVILKVPPGRFLVKKEIVIDFSQFLIEGAGQQASSFIFNNGALNCFSIYSAVDGQQVRDVHLSRIGVYGTNKTDGSHVYIKNAYRCGIDGMSLEYAINGLVVDYGTNAISATDVIITANQAESKIGIAWICDPSTGYRNDVLTLRNVAVECSGSKATSLLLDGFVQTLVGQNIRLMHGDYGMRVRNTSGDHSKVPCFVNVHDLEIEGAFTRALLIEAGQEIKITTSDISNQGYAGNDYAVVIQADSNQSVTRGIQITNTRIGDCNASAVFIDARDVQLSNIECFSSSSGGIGAYPAVTISGNASDVQINNLVAEEYGGKGFSSHAVRVQAGAYNVQLSNINGNFCTSGAVDNQTTVETVQVSNTLYNGGNAQGFTSIGNYETRLVGSRAGDNITLNVVNKSTANNAKAVVQQTTGLANAFIQSYVNNGAGVPYWQQDAGSGLTGGFNYKAPQYVWQNMSGQRLFAVGTALPTFSNDASAAAGGVPINGYYRNGSVVMQRQS
ncbi:hypothetical protein [Burkholderia phage vB_BpP_HN02]|uniref:Pectate lyase superfamily protein domain-containing protein n=1 Tax=Burkholderia phage vB_BpP_HN02 TaxID=3116925 RepID=A0AAX4JHY8_9CAUD